MKIPSIRPKSLILTPRRRSQPLSPAAGQETR